MLTILKFPPTLIGRDNSTRGTLYSLEKLNNISSLSPEPFCLCAIYAQPMVAVGIGS